MSKRSPVDAHTLLIVAWLVAGLPAACKQTHIVLDPLTNPPETDGGTSDASATDGAGGPGGTGGAAPAAGPVTALNTAYYHTCAIAGGALYCWGANDEGRLGLGDTKDRRTPARVGVDSDWIDIQVGERSSLGLKRDGSIWSFGGNDVGQLGQGDFVALKTPTRIGTRADWTAIATRFDHACALAADGSLWCWGQNTEGQLGQDETNTASMDRPTPVQVTTARDFAAVDAGQGHTCAIRRNGTLWCWGRNTDSILGQGAGSPVQIHHPVQVGSATDWQIVRSGQSSTCGLRGAVVYCWGRVVDQSQPGSADGTDVPVPTAIGGPAGASGLTFNTFGGCSFDARGAGACWGRNAEGQLGLGDMSVQTDVVALPLGNWTWLSAGRFSTCGIRGGHVWCTGDNRNGQIGQGSVDRVATFMEVAL